MHVHVVAGQLFCGQLSSHHLSLSASKSEPGPVVVPLQIPNVQPGSATHVDSCSTVQSESLALHVLQTWGVHPSGTAGGSDGRGDGGERGGDGGDDGPHVDAPAGCVQTSSLIAYGGAPPSVVSAGLLPGKHSSLQPALHAPFKLDTTPSPLAKLPDDV